MYIKSPYNYQDFMVYSFNINACNIDKDICNSFILNF